MPLNLAVQLTLLYGDAALLIERATDELVDAILPGEARGYGLTVMDVGQVPLGQVGLQLRTGSLMAATRVVVLRDVDSLSAAQQGELAGLLGAPPAGVHVIMAASASRQEANKGLPVSAKLRKLVEEKGQSASFITPFEREMAEWVVSEALRLGKRIDRAVAEQLVALAGRDHARLSSELQKLCCYVGAASQITAQDVAAAASRSAEASSFDLVDAIAEGNARAALSMLPDLLPSQSVQSAAIPLLGMVARHLRLMWQAAYLAQCGSPVDRSLRVGPDVVALLPEQQNVLQAARTSFVAKKLARHARTLGDQELAAALKKVLDADRALKGQTDEHMDPRLVMERLVTELCLLAQRAGGAGARR